MKKLKNILLEAKAKKPDYIDLDKDGDTEESMKKAAADKNSMKEEEDADTCPECGNSPCTCEDESVDMNVLNMSSLDEYGDDETHSIHSDSPKNSESDVREKEITEAFWNRVKGNLHGHEYILREAFRK